ncbi:hypothetical protein JHK85_045122 [Glycine max]|nr:hypothetical protein JHK85_045122 [Glycine max]
MSLNNYKHPNTSKNLDLFVLSHHIYKYDKVHSFGLHYIYHHQRIHLDSIISVIIGDFAESFQFIEIL